MTVVLPDPAVARTRASGTTRGRRPTDWMLRQLPVAMLSEDFLVRFVSIFQDVGNRLLEDADGIEHVPDVTVTPTDLIPWLGSWIGVETIDRSMPEELQRRIVRSAAATMTWRGTAYGLRSYLELLSGGPAEVSEGGGVWRSGEAPPDTAWVRLQVDSTGLLAEAEFVDVVADEVPAHVHAELYVGSRRVWTSDDRPGPSSREDQE
ncbi:phage tail protein [Nocardioides sp.]|uniref:phage tail protein n=1 Tax=Nocardioides sp. TaxID=35761 RepID=UPI0027361DE9|nr:phage tail protein [Nocardioides sp.]MDP3893692.1 phage tail protein [Nocardioides sp.]